MKIFITGSKSSSVNSFPVKIPVKEDVNLEKKPFFVSTFSSSSIESKLLSFKLMSSSSFSSMNVLLPEL
jgi:hypothetical protein